MERARAGARAEKIAPLDDTELKTSPLSDQPLTGPYMGPSGDVSGPQITPQENESSLVQCVVNVTRIVCVAWGGMLVISILLQAEGDAYTGRMSSTETPVVSPSHQGIQSVYTELKCISLFVVRALVTVATFVTRQLFPTPITIEDLKRFLGRALGSYMGVIVGE